MLPEEEKVGDLGSVIEVDVLVEGAPLQKSGNVSLWDETDDAVDKLAEQLQVRPGTRKKRPREAKRTYLPFRPPV